MLFDVINLLSSTTSWDSVTIDHHAPTSPSQLFMRNELCVMGISDLYTALRVNDYVPEILPYVTHRVEGSHGRRDTNACSCAGQIQAHHHRRRVTTNLTAHHNHSRLLENSVTGHPKSSTRPILLCIPEGGFARQYAWNRYPPIRAAKQLSWDTLLEHAGKYFICMQVMGIFSRFSIPQLFSSLPHLRWSIAP